MAIMKLVSMKFPELWSFHDAMERGAVKAKSA
jgi:hypothetical protein